MNVDVKNSSYLLILGLVIGLILGGLIGSFYSSFKDADNGFSAVVVDSKDRGSVYELTTIITNSKSSNSTASIFIPKSVLKGLDIGSEAEKVAAPTQPPTQTPAPPPTVKLDMNEIMDDDPGIGEEDATIMMVEFSDFQCPFCQRFYEQTLPQIKRDYIETGDLRLVYRDFPLSSIHPEAQKAAESAECAEDQGKFWEYHDKLFEDVSNWSGAGTSKFKEYASDLGLDTAAFNECLDSDKYREEVLKDFQDGRALGVSGTPTFFINGQKLVGAQPYESFKQVLDAELTMG